PFLTSHRNYSRCGASGFHFLRRNHGQVNLGTSRNKEKVRGVLGRSHQGAAVTANAFCSLVLGAITYWAILTSSRQSVGSSLVFHGCRPCLHRLIGIRWADN